jgi:undecaprenyl diphosphate synthase
MPRSPFQPARFNGLKPSANGHAAATPNHVAIIMDGSGRWAQERGLSRQAGHRAGTENIRRVIQAFAEREVSYLTLRLTHIGSLDPLSPELQRRICDAMELTKDNRRLTVCVAFNYGGRAEIVEAARRMVQDGVDPTRIDEGLFGRYLSTDGIPDPDLVIRTAGEMRLSNFLIWQAAYAEYYSTPAYWPDFDEAEIDRAIEAYGQRTRRFGGLVATKPGTNGNGVHPSV